MTDAFDTTSDSAERQELLIAALREELSGYGALLNLLKEQQEAVLDRKPDSVLTISTAIESQIKTMQVHRQRRVAAMEELTRLAGIPKSSTLRILSPYFRPALRPLVEALVDEVNRLITQTRRCAEQNQVLLARSMELAEELMKRLHPHAVSKTYSARGKVNIKLAAGMSRLLNKS